MVGITSFGAYIPLFRLSRDAIAKAWLRDSLGGERSVANSDEDSMTMAVEAAFDCLRGVERKNVDGLFFASTTAPYKEKQCSTLVAAVADMESEIITADYANCLRAGTNALRSALNAVSAGRARNILVAAADCRLGYPRSDFEQSFGDGAAALLVGDSGAIATLEESYSCSEEMLDVWRTDEDTFVRSWEGRWVLGEGYSANIQRATKEVMKRSRLEPKDFAKAIFPSPDTRTHRRLAQSTGFDIGSQVQDPLLAAVGHCGAAHSLMMLVAALEEAKPGDRILLTSYGDGADAFVFQVTEEIEKLEERRGVKGHIASKMSLPSYERYLSYRDIVGTVPSEPFRLFPSATVLWRDRNSTLRCHGSRCRRCGVVSYPIQRICINCRSKDDFEEVRLSDKGGKVFTFSSDNLAGRSDDPVVVQTVVESEEGAARIYCMMTDCQPSEVKVDMPVELTFRRIYEGAGFHNYFWKCRPPREGGK
ncbi:MAG: hydroxymethylglutaryl-CoA synthase family protein [Chloroflexi bacterium]|nr:hydroxymethylglutaryl-CoA synthase family protein [Chloroflexota bacterium]